MTAAPSTRFESVTPILRVADVKASIAYYVEKLGFGCPWNWPDGSDRKTFGGVSRDGVRLFFCSDGQGPVEGGVWMSMWVEDVDALHEELKARGAMIRQPPTNMPWGVREMNVQDPDGHRIRMSMEATGPSDGVALMED